MFEFRAREREATRRSLIRGVHRAWSLARLWPRIANWDMVLLGMGDNGYPIPETEMKKAPWARSRILAHPK